MQFFGLTFALSWGAVGAYIAARAVRPDLPPLDLQHPLIVLFFCAPGLAAFALAARARGFSGVLDLASRAVRGFKLSALLIAVLALPLIVCALSLGAAALGQPWPIAPQAALVALPLALATTPALVSSIAPLGEEFGWRGYALPLLLARMSPWSASLLLGLVWSVWHLPLFALNGVFAMTLVALGWWTATTLALTLLMTALFIRSGGNVVIAGMIPHAMINAIGGAGYWSDRPAETATLALVACALTLGLGRRRR